MLIEEIDSKPMLNSASDGGTPLRIVGGITRQE